MLKSGNILLRAVEPSDIDMMYIWENDPDIWRVSNTVAPFSRHILERYVNSVQDIYAEKQLRLIIEKVSSSKTRGAVKNQLGCVDLFDFNPLHLRAGIGILIAGRERRKGYASEALKIVIRYAFKTLCLHQLFCHVHADNKASLQLFRKHNFSISGIQKEWVKVGKKWHDEYLLQLINK